MPKTDSCCSYGFTPGVTPSCVALHVEQVVGNARKLEFSIKVKPAGVAPLAKLASVVESVPGPPQNRPPLLKAGSIVLRSEVFRPYTQFCQYWPPNELMARFSFMMS